MKTFLDNHFSALVTDPPYGLHFMGKGWDKFHYQSLGDHRNTTVRNGAMNAGKYNEHRNDEFQEFIHQVSQEFLRILKPGGHVLMFGAPRRYHRQVCALEDAGFEIRECLMWLFGSGFPKSHNHFGIEGYGTALKPAYEPIIMAMKPLDGTFKQNAEKWGQAGINIDGCRIETTDNRARKNHIEPGFSGGWGAKDTESHPQGRWPANVILDESFERILSLKDNISSGIIVVIKEYFSDYSLPDLPKNNKNLSKSNQKEQGTILQSSLLQSCINGEIERGFPSYEGEKASSDINRCNEKETDSKGEKESSVSGLLVQSGLSIHQFTGIAEQSSRNSQENDSSQRNCGTSNNYGGIFESTPEQFGGSSSPKWSEGRQSNRESRDDEQLDPQERTQRDFEGIEDIEIGKRTLKVLACHIPENWLKYFEETGEEMRSPYCSGAMLDEQSGIGASRFFYCAKASSVERNEGLDSDPQPSGTKNHSGRGFSESDPYREVKYRNSHPTVKPIRLMEYLIKLVMPPSNGLLLDPFAGSGTTILAAKRLGFDAIGIEKESEYAEIARARIDHQPKEESQDQMELFGFG